jgi:hypothetical protein
VTGNQATNATRTVEKVFAC